MIKKIYPYFIVAGLIVAFFLLTKKKIPVPVQTDTNQKSDLIIYWGDGCPHCENVKKYISDNKVDEKLRFNWKEVYKNQENQKEIVEVVDKKCPELKTGQGIPVPLGYSESENKCYVGDIPIINWIKLKTSQ